MTPKFPGEFRYLEIQLPSVNYTDIIAQLPRACSYLDECFARDGRVLVYCSDGISRGPAIVVGESLSRALTTDATIGVFGCPTTIVKLQPQLLKT
jgi:hypothetical protein